MSMKALTAEQREAALSEALRQAEASWNQGGIPIGASLVSPDGNVVASGHNERVQTGDPTAHAEMVCVRRAGRRRDWPSLTLVSTLSPCAMCSGTAILYRIPRIVIAENRSFLGAEDWMRHEGIELQVLQDERAIALMARLMKEKPDLWAEDIGL